MPRCEGGRHSQLRNEYFKGSTSPKSPTTFDNGATSCLLFEGFMDMLSYLTLKNTIRPTVDIAVLNSVNNLCRAEVFLKRHATIHCFLDNDTAGQNTLRKVEALATEVVDSGMSAHIERRIAPKNADPERTHLNRELIEFPDTVAKRTGAIEHRLDTAGLQRKIGKNQVRAVRILLTGSPADMKRIEQARQLDNWCRDNLDWLKKTYGAENIVSAVMHFDETTPHIHATMIPIVTSERVRKKREEGKKRYRAKKGNAPRLSADDVMSRAKLKEYQNTYAQAMAKYGLRRGIEGSVAKHISISHYYRDLLNQSECIQANITELLLQKEQAQQELDKAKSDISKEKLKNSAADVGATLLDGVGSLFGGNKAKQQQQKIENLEAENHYLAADVKNLNSKIKTMQTEHATAIGKLTAQIDKIFNYFPHIKELLRWEGFLLKLGLPEGMVKRLFNNESVVGSGELRSSEYNKSFKTENATLKLEQDKAKPSNIRLTINGTNILDWFKQRQQEFLFTIGAKSVEQKQNKMKL